MVEEFLVKEQRGTAGRKIGAVLVRRAVCRSLLHADMAVSVTGLAGPGGDDYGNPVGTVCIGYADKRQRLAKQYRFYGDRDEIREQAVRAALELAMEVNS